MRKKRKGKVLTIIVILLIVIAGAAGIVFNHFTSKTNYQSDKDVKINEEAYETEKVKPEDLYHPEEVEQLPEEKMDGMYTLLVIGGASPEDEKAGKDREDADAILLLNFNTPMKTLYLAAFDTSLYTDIPGQGPGKLGNAYAVGGGPLLSQTITENYGVPINNYGVISLKDAARILNLPELEDVDISHEGVDVIRQLVFSLNISDPGEVVSSLTSMLSHVTHNIDSKQMVNLLLKAPGYVSFYSSDDIIPYEGLYQTVDEYVVPDIGATSRKLQETMFARP